LTELKRKVVSKASQSKHTYFQKKTEKERFAKSELVEYASIVQRYACQARNKNMLTLNSYNAINELQEKQKETHIQAYLQHGINLIVDQRQDHIK
jgi:flagellar motor component MotA